MATIASLLVVMGMDTKGLTAGTAKAESSLAGLAGKTSLASKAFVGIGVAAVAGVAVAIKAGSDLNEQMNKSKEVFEESSQEVLDFATTTASSMGVSETAALEAAGSFGQLFQAAGIAVDKSAQMSEQFVQLAADLASFNNIDPNEALQKLESGLAGMARPLRSVGVFLSEARVETEAYTSGIAEQGAVLTDAQKVQARYNLIMKDTAKAQGDFARTVGESLPNQMRKFKAEVEDTAAALGIKLLPVALDAAKSLQSLVPILQAIAPVLLVVGKNFALLLGTFAVFKVGSMAAAAGMETFGAALGPIAGIIAGAVIAGQTLNDVFFAADMTVDELAQSVGGQLEPALAQGIITTQEYAAAAAALHDPSMENVKALLEVQVKLDAASRSAEEATARTAALTKETDAYVAAANDGGRAAANMASKLSKSAKEIKQGIAEEVPGIIGTITTIKDTFTITPAELVKITRSWAQIAKRIAADLLIIAESDLKPAMRAAISALPPEMRDAWARGNDKQRAAIEASIKKTLAIQDLIPGLAGDALRGGATVGKAMDTGTISGLAAGSPAVAQAAGRVIERAIAAAKVAAGAQSPSKVMAELGHDLMTGLANGISDAEEKALKAAQKAIEATIKEIEKRIDSVSSALDKIKSKASAFRDTIAGGISGFGDLAGAFTSAQGEEGGMPLSVVIAAQVGQAQQMADVLEALKRQGASQALLAQASGDVGFGQALLQGGPAQIAQANAALKTIADLAQQTGKGLSEAFFGQKIDKIEHKLDILHEDLKAANQQDKVIVNIQGWVGNDQDIAKRVRDELVKLGKRNVTTGI